MNYMMYENDVALVISESSQITCMYMQTWHARKINKQVTQSVLLIYVSA